MNPKQINTITFFLFVLVNLFAFLFILQEVEDTGTKITLIVYSIYSSLSPFVLNLYSKETQETHYININDSDIESRFDTAKENKLDLFSLGRGDTLYAVMIYFLKDRTFFTCRLIKVKVEDIIARNGLRDYKLRDIINGDVFIVPEEKLKDHFYSDILYALKRRLDRIDQEIFFIEKVKRKIEFQIQEGGRKT